MERVNSEPANLRKSERKDRGGEGDSGGRRREEALANVFASRPQALPTVVPASVRPVSPRTTARFSFYRWCTGAFRRADLAPRKRALFQLVPRALPESRSGGVLAPREHAAKCQF